MAKFCSNCGKEINENAVVCIGCGAAVRNSKINNTDEKSKIVAGLLALFFGTIGIHNFYLGYKGKGIAQLLITVLTLGFGAIITGIWAMIEAIMIFTGSIKDANGNSLIN